MIRRTSIGAAAVFVAVAFTSSWYVSAQSSPSSSAASRAASPAVAALNPAPSPEALGFDTQRLAKLDAYMAKVVVATGRVAGMTTLLARHGQVVSYKTYGKQEPRDRRADDARTPSSASTR